MSRPRLLLADDHAAMREHVARVVTDGYEVVGVAADGAEAVASYETLRPDIVVLDVEMPGVNGLDAARRIIGIDPEACIIMLSVHEDPEYVDAAMAAGARAYVFKPRLCSDLWEAMRCALEV